MTWISKTWTRRRARARGRAHGTRLLAAEQLEQKNLLSGSPPTDVAAFGLGPHDGELGPANAGPPEDAVCDGSGAGNPAEQGHLVRYFGRHDLGHLARYFGRRFESDQTPPVDAPHGGQPDETPPVDAPVGERPEDAPQQSGPHGEQPEETPPVDAPHGEQPDERPPVDAPVGEQPEDAPLQSGPHGEQPEETPPVDAPHGEQADERPPVDAPVGEQPEDVPQQSGPHGEQPEMAPPDGAPHGDAAAGVPPGECSGECKTAGELTEDETASIQHLREEEKLARDVYLTLGTLWDNPLFDNIAESESRHMAAVESLIDKYSLDDPVTDDTVGQFSNPLFAQLYADLVGSQVVDLEYLGLNLAIEGGAVSEVAAYRVGAFVEELDILDLRHALPCVTHTDVQQVFENLLRGSSNHLRAFVSAIETMDEVYEPVVLTGLDPETGEDLDALYEAIVSSDVGTGHGGGAGPYGSRNQGAGGECPATTDEDPSGLGPALEDFGFANGGN